MSSNNKKNRVFIKIDAELNNVSVSAPGDQTLNGLLEYILPRVSINTETITYPFARGAIERLESVSVPPCAYFIENSPIGKVVTVYDLLSFGETVLQAGKFIVLAVDYKEAVYFPFPLHEPVDAVKVEDNRDSGILLIEFICKNQPITKLHRYRPIADKENGVHKTADFIK